MSEDYQAKYERIVAGIQEITNDANIWGTCGHEWATIGRLNKLIKDDE